MTKHFNKQDMKQRRRELRKNMTFCEKLGWTYLRKKQLQARFLRQYSIDHYVIDFYCPKLKLAVEIDGEYHEKQEQKIYDKERQSYLENFGITFVRIKNDELLGNPDLAFKRIEQEVRKLTSPKMGLSKK
ncbi:MAG: DUF559 domain-containing protein [Ignavibacterium sp.]|nr:DUF559 domain-containing protein [Ignavibacterium sp.]